MGELVLTGPEIAKTLYKSISSCSDHHSDKIISQIHIQTEVDDAIIKAAHENKIVIITGNPGDGKTHLIRKAREYFPEHLKRTSSQVKTDANENSEKEIVEAINSSIERKSALIIAINEGILLEICHNNTKTCPHWAPEIIKRILMPYKYGSEPEKINKRFLLVDLNLRNNLSKDMTSKILNKVIELIEESPMSNIGIERNISAVKNGDIAERLFYLLELVGKSGFHATMRDVFGFFSYILCATEISQETANQSALHYSQNAFEGGQGPLFEQIRRFDPLYHPNPFLDDQLFLFQDDTDDWIILDPDEIAKEGDDAIYRKRKRRAFFEHKSGKQIVTLDRQTVDSEFLRLTSTSDSQQIAVRMLNSFFKSNEISDSLVLWVYHQFSVHPIRYLVSRQSIRISDLRISVPYLPEPLASTFPGSTIDHVILHHINQPLSEGLYIDRRLISMLKDGDRRTGTGTRTLEVQIKIASFYDRLSQYAQAGSTIKILRLDTQNIAQITVDIKNKTYSL